MAHLLTTATLGVLAVAGSATGVFLGRAAVSEINPIYFAERADTFHADLVPYRPQAASDAALTDAGRLTPAELAEGLGTGCVGCRTYPEDYRPVQDPAVEPERYRERVGDAPAVQLAVYDPQADEAGRSADFAQVERYSGYQVSAAAEAPAEVEFAAASEDVPAAE
jgi:hypothetical protein